MVSLALASSRVPSSALAGPTSGAVRSLSRDAVPRPAVAVTTVTFSWSVPVGGAHLLRRSSLRVPTAPTPRPGASYVTKYRSCACKVGGDARAEALLADIAADMADTMPPPPPPPILLPNLLDTFLRTLLMRSPFKDAQLVTAEAAENNLELLSPNMADPPTPQDAAPFVAVATARVALATAAARLAVFSRRMRLHMLQLRSVRLSDRAASLAMLHLPMPAQLAQLGLRHAHQLLALQQNRPADLCTFGQ